MENTTMTSLPEIERKKESCWPEILKRLPVSQLAVCLSVSKKWYSLITSPVFITSQISFLSQTNFQSSNLFLLRSLLKETPEKPIKESYHICSESDETLKTLPKKTFQHPFKTKFGVQFRLVGSVNGVIFLSDDYIKSRDLFLWNPIVNCFIQLPEPLAIQPCMVASGLGYDSVNDDFKVVRGGYDLFQNRGISMDKTPPRAELYSVKEGKWRRIKADHVEYCIVDNVWSQCFLRGNIHWVAYERFGEENSWSHKSNLFLLFNVEEEKFMWMKLPSELKEVCPLNLVVSEFQKMLCVNQYVMGEPLPLELVHYNLWVTVVYDKPVYWVKVASVDLKGSGLKKVVYWGKNGELLGPNKGNDLVSYDPETNNVKVLKSGCGDLIDDVFVYPAVYEACSFVETLAFLNKDCKNRRSFLPVIEGQAESNNVEQLTPSAVQAKAMGKHFFYMLQLEMFRRRF